MHVFDLGPGKEIGQIKVTIREAILEGHIRNDLASGWDLLVHEGAKLGLSPVVSLDEFLNL
jgi:hypothetical protein